MIMKCLNLTDIELNLALDKFKHFVRVDHLYISSCLKNQEQVLFLKSLNIKNVIDLKSPDETTFKDEKEFEKSEINYINIPIVNIDELKFEQLTYFGSLINKGRGKTLIYCMSGNRVSALLALNSCLICGHPKKRALEFGEKVGMKDFNTKVIVSNLLEKGRLA